MARKSKVSVQARNTRVQAGIDKYVPGNLTLGGVNYTPAALKAVFSDQSTAMDRSDDLHTQWKDQLQATKSATVKADAVYELLRSYVISQYGKQANVVLGAFGMPVPKPTGVRAPAAQVAAAQKAKATRKIRNTTGSVQKKEQKGTIEVPVVAVTTITPVLPSHTATTPPEEPTAPPTAAPPAKPVG